MFQLIFMVMYLPCYPVCLHLLWSSLFCVIGHMRLFHWPIFFFSALRAIRLLKARASVRICGLKPWIHINLLNFVSLVSLRSKVGFSGSNWKVGMNRACMCTFFSYYLIEIFRAHDLTEYQKKWHVNTIFFSLFLFVYRSDQAVTRLYSGCWEYEYLPCGLVWSERLSTNTFTKDCLWVSHTNGFICVRNENICFESDIYFIKKKNV